METVTNIEWSWGWYAGFAAFVLAALVVDLVVLDKKAGQKVTVKEAIIWSLIWFSLSFVFAGGLWWHLEGTVGRELANLKTTEFLTGYLIEKSLSVDNIFVFLMVFTYFAIPAEYQRRALVLGVIGAIVLRVIMILVGAWLITKFHWILYLFGLFLLATGVKMLIFADQKPDLEKNPVLKWMRGHLKITSGLHGEQLTVMKDGVKWFTPMFVVLVLIGVTDVVFAVDSIPAIFAITSDPFIVLTSNIFAILGLRALYFLLADMADRFHLLSYGLALVLIFVGVKMLIVDFWKIPVFMSLGVVGLILATAITVSLIVPKKAETPANQ
ncbi:MAG: TerC family protein [Betaproteobacteria bacterium]|nr:TerC family protein [Betaproteobacteria bacterium]